MDLYKLKTEHTARDIRNLHELWSKPSIETYSNCDRSLDELRSKLRRAAIEAIDRWRRDGPALDPAHLSVFWLGAIEQVGSLGGTSQATCEQVGSSVGGRTTEQDYGGHQIAGSCPSIEEAIDQDCGSSMESRKRHRRDDNCRNSVIE